LAAKWGLDPRLLGQAQTGMEMDIDAAESMQLPGPRELFDYLDEAFSALEIRLNGLSDQAMSEAIEDFYGRDTNVGAFLLNHLSHMDRHLGVIEGLKGVLGMEGSATV
jgi:hypothetical protein